MRDGYSGEQSAAFFQKLSDRVKTPAGGLRFQPHRDRSDGAHGQRQRDVFEHGEDARQVRA